MQQRHRLLTSGSIQRALPNRLQKHTILSACRPSGIAAAYPKVVAVFISNDKQRPEGLSVLERHGRGGMKLREASNSCDKGVAQHVHAQQAGDPYCCHQPSQAQVNSGACTVHNAISAPGTWHQEDDAVAHV